jgi:diacylglycerol kinase family enzyme
MSTDPHGQVTALQRGLAVASIVLLPIGLLMVLYGFIKGLPQLIGAVITLALAALCVWQSLGHRRLARWLWAVSAAVLLVATAVMIYASGREVLWIGIGTAVTAIGGATGRTALLRAPRPEGRHHLRRPMYQPEHPILFVNPRSGDGTAGRVGLVAAAQEAGVQVVELSKGDDLTAMVRQAVADGADCLGAAGGDGTLAQVAMVSIDEELPFVCIPAGTRNHFALDLGLDRTDPLGALDAFQDAYVKRIDVADVNGHMFLNNVSVGAYGEVVADEQYRENKLGTALSKLPEIIGPDSDPLDLQFTDGDGERHESAIVLHVSNNAYELSPRPGFGTRPSLSDGLLGIVAVVHAPTLTGPIKMIRWEAPDFEVSSGAEVPAGLDGEAMDFDPPMRFSIRPGVLEVRIPVHALGVSPAALRPKLSKRTFERLGSLAAGRVPAI